jgi:hypothetical protein
VLTRALPQGAGDTEAFLNSVVRSLHAEQPEASGGAFEQLDAFTEELQRCAGVLCAAGAACAQRA